MIRVEKINKSYGSGADAVHVLRNVDLEVRDGEFVSIMGSSGSGKSTLLNVLGILDRYDTGAYYLDDRLVRDLSEREAAQYRNRFLGFVFQSFNLLTFKTAAENVALPLYYQGVSRRATHALARTKCSSASGLRPALTTCRTSYRVASGSASPLRERS